MTGFLDLPREVRDMIYAHVARGDKVKYTSGMMSDGQSLRLSTSGALLQCSKLVHAEYLPVFCQTARLDISTLINTKTGVIDSPSDVTLNMLAHLKLHQNVFAEAGAMQFLKSLSNLQSLLRYGGSLRYDILDYPGAEYDCGSCGGNSCIVCAHNLVKWQVKRQTSRLTGKCNCDDDNGEAYIEDNTCKGDSPVRKVITVWDYLDHPFKFVTMFNISIDLEDNEDGILLHLVAYFHLGSKMMTVYKTRGPRSKRFLGKFKVPIDKY